MNVFQYLETNGKHANRNIVTIVKYFLEPCCSGDRLHIKDLDIGRFYQLDLRK